VSSAGRKIWGSGMAQASRGAVKALTRARDLDRGGGGRVKKLGWPPVSKRGGGRFPE